MSLETVLQTKYDQPREITQVGDVVVAVTPGYGLRSGGEAYDFAIIVQIEPKIVGVSEQTDMRWGSTIDTENFKAIGLATEEAVRKCMVRL